LRPRALPSLLPSLTSQKTPQCLDKLNGLLHRDLRISQHAAEAVNDKPTIQQAFISLFTKMKAAYPEK
jgi:hypothetical protein